MAGLRPETPIPVEIKLRRKSRLLEITFDDDGRFELSYEFLRVFSPSAEVRGHGIGQEKLQIGKRDIDILRIEPVGNYAIRPVFSDGHESGLYSWDVLHDLCLRRDELWQTYLDRLASAGASRDPAECPGLPPKPAPGCARGAA
ncbi:MAG: DUF971 domain-containing protein [Candidatus Accumulibacter sp.]|jgi:DUF971 family protein|nr:DUF971 domain-containing protein [Accumulibacter sp.]